MTCNFKFFSFLISFLLIVNVLYSQNPSQNGVVYERNEDKSVTFNFNKETAGSTYVILNLNQLTNTSSDKTIKKTIKGYSGTLGELTPNNADEHISFSYSYRTMYGDINAKPNTSFRYVLPFKAGVEVKVRDLNYLGQRVGGTNPKNFRSFQFFAKPNDTVCAIRKGVVVRIKDGNAADAKSEYGFRSKSNSVLIEHKDGTLANYDVLKKGSFMINVGDVVYPSTPLAIAGTYDTEKNSQLRLSIYYLDKLVKDYDFSNLKKESLENRTHFYAYIDPLFVVNSDGSGILKLNKNEAYTSYSDDIIIQSEMTKREKKKFLKSKK